MTGISEWQGQNLEWVLFENVTINANPKYIQSYTFDWAMKTNTKNLRFSTFYYMEGIFVKSRLKTYKMLAKLK